MPIQRRSSAWATIAVVPEPKKGSRTVQGMTSALQEQVGCQPIVWGGWYEFHSFCPPPMYCLSAPSGRPVILTGCW